MRAKIDKNGVLHIERKGRFVKAWCHKQGRYVCGDRCHYFVEGIYKRGALDPVFLGNNHPPKDGTHFVLIECCSKDVKYKIVEDLRGEE
jgi:hypothetical protein